MPSVRARLTCGTRAHGRKNFRMTLAAVTRSFSTRLSLSTKVLETIPKTIAVPVAGVGGETSVRLGQVRVCSLGASRLRSLWTTFAQSQRVRSLIQTSRETLRGILRRFKVIFDYRIVA